MNGYLLRVVKSSRGIPLRVFETRDELEAFIGENFQASSLTKYYLYDLLFETAEVCKTGLSDLVKFEALRFVDGQFDAEVTTYESTDQSE